MKSLLILTIFRFKGAAMQTLRVAKRGLTITALGCLTLFSVAGCGSKAIRLESTPSGATVLLNDKEIGQTPMNIEKNNFAAEFDQPVLNLKLNLVGHEPKSLLLATNAHQEINIQLVPFNAEYFEKTLIKDFQKPTNEMVREILQIQGLLMSKKIDQARERLETFTKKFPNIAAGYVLRANLEIQSQQQEAALRNLERAQALAPDDATVARMIENIRRSAP